LFVSWFYERINDDDDDDDEMNRGFFVIIRCEELTVVDQNVLIHRMSFRFFFDNVTVPADTTSSKD